MRTTKVLLAAASVGAVGLATSMAQVYSANVVGFVNLTILPKYNLVVNQLNVTNNNPVGAVIPSIPGNLDGIKIFKWNAASQSFNAEIEFFPGADVPGWYQGDTLSTASLNPGEGFFLFNGSAPATTFTLTLVGEVPQSQSGQPLTVNVPLNYSALGSVVPQSLSLTALSFPERSGMKYFKWLPATQGFAAEVEYFGPADTDVPGWYQGDTKVDPTPAIGEGFFLFNRSGSAQTWSRTFTVN